MKILTPILILVFNLVLLSCSQTENLENVAQLSRPHSENTFYQADAEIILDITSNFEGDLSWVKGKIINFRLYADGLVEFDDYPIESTTGKQLIAGEVIDRKQVKINEAQLNEIKNILSNSEFRSLKKKYVKLKSSCDAIPKVTIKAKNKIIEIVWCDNLTEPKSSPDFPKTLSKIFKQTREVRNILLGKEVASP